MRRLRHAVRPLRVRLTLTFASVVAVVLAVAGLLVYDQFRRDLGALTDAELTERQAAIQAFARRQPDSRRLLAIAGEPLAQVYGPRGTVSASTQALGSERLLEPEQLAAARRRPVLIDVSEIPGGDDGARARAFAIDGARAAVIAEDLGTRERALHRLAVLLALVLPGALLLSSLAGLQVARAALAPVERMRRRAMQISERAPAQRLPEPGTGDELERLAHTLNDLLERLAGALERERRIVGDASHELRTPISILRTRVDVALREPPTVAGLQLALTEAGEDAKRLARLADDLLVLARADQGQLTLRREPLDVQDVLEQTAARHSVDTADSQPIAIHNAIDGGAVVLADPGRLAQTLDNLVVNARRYGEGPIELSADTAPGGQVAFAVRDHGPGFPPEFIPRAFERFSQAGHARGRAGSGLGLALVAAIAHAHGGRAHAGNAPGGGAVTTVTVPLA